MNDVVQQATAGLRLPDVIVLALYLVGVFVLGAMFAKGQRTTKDFFLAGRSMGWIPVAFSLAASIFSAISFMATPSFVARFGIGTMITMVGTLLTFPLVLWLFIPLYHRLQVYTGYEYLERRFDVRVRCMASGMFVVWRILWMATALYVPCLALHVAIGSTDDRLLYALIVALGVVATAYTALGGMKAVIWTDVLQFGVLFGGVALTIYYLGSNLEGGLGGIWQYARENHLMVLSWERSSLPDGASLWDWANWYFRLPLSVPAIVASTFVSQLGFFTVDQVMLQRYLSVKSASSAQRSFLLNFVGLSSVGILLTFVGIGLAAFYQGTLPEAITDGNWDRVFPYFVAHEMWVGVAGLVIAALMAASMSSVDSGINTATTAVLVDFYQRLVKGRIYPAESEEHPEEQHRQLVLARWLTVILGLGSTVLACFVGKLGDIVTIANLIINNFAGPMLGMFLLGLFSRRASAWGVLVGPVIGIFTALVMTMPFFHVKVASWWSSSIGLIVTLVTGYLISLIGNLAQGEPRPDKLSGLTWRQRKDPIVRGP